MSQVLIDRALLKQALEALAKNLTRYASQPSSIWRYFYPSATGDYVNLREFMERAEPIITALRAALAQEEQEPLSADTLARALVASRVIDPAAIDDPDGYDDGVMLERVRGLHRRLAALAALKERNHG